MSLYESSVRKPVMTSIIFIAVVILGLFSFKKLPIDLLPKIETNTIMVMTTYNGASASDVETNVTKPLEGSLNTVSNLKNIKSTSKENRSIITMEFDYGLDLNVVTNDIRNKLDLVKSYFDPSSGVQTYLISLRAWLPFEFVNISKGFFQDKAITHTK